MTKKTESNENIKSQNITIVTVSFFRENKKKMKYSMNVKFIRTLWDKKLCILRSIEMKMKEMGNS